MTESKSKKGKVAHELGERTAGYIIAAFGFVAGLAWNDAIRTLIDTLFPVRKDSLPVKFLYAALVTIVVVLISMLILKVVKKDPPSETKK